MRKNNFHEILTRAPVNATASRVVSRGFQYEPKINPKNSDSALPLKMRAVTEAMLLGAKDMVDLTGVRWGRLTVLGLSVKSQRWVCRCDCGSYTLRQAAGIKSQKEEGLCTTCAHFKHLRWKSSRKSK